jgi:hypothetical protein
MESASSFQIGAPCEKMKAVKKYSLSTLLALGLALNANAAKGDEKKDKDKKVEVVDSLT